MYCLAPETYSEKTSFTPFIMHTTVLHQSYSFKLILQKQLLRKMQPKVHQEDTNSKFLIRLIVFSSKCSLEYPRLWRITVIFAPVIHTGLMNVSTYFFLTMYGTYTYLKIRKSFPNSTCNRKLELVCCKKQQKEFLTSYWFQE